MDGHTFGNLTGSDHVILSLADATGEKKMEVKIDYVTASTLPEDGSRYGSLCVSGGEESGCLVRSSGSTYFQAEAQLGLTLRF